MLNKKFAYLPLASLISVATAGTAALAQQAPPVAAPATQTPPADNGTGLQEIVVTAQKRTQNLNNVGLSVNVASGDQLTSLGVRSTDDLVKIAPGLTFAKSVDGSPLYTLRGVGFNDFTLGASPAVSIYVDQVGLAYGQFAKGATLDLQRVEVVKGPQGILFGQNATGGAINYVANKPTQTLEAGGGLSYGRFNTFDGDAYLSGPISDTLAVRVAGATTQSGPWQQSVSRKDALGRQNDFRGRFLAEWKPTDKLTLLFDANGWRDNSDTQAAQLVGIALQEQSGAGQGDPAEIDRRIAALKAAPLAQDNARSADWNDGSALKRHDGFYQFSLRVDYKATDQITVTSITAYSKLHEDYGLDRDGTALNDENAQVTSRTSTFNQELRIASDSPRLNWVAGGNYSRNNVYSSGYAFIGDATNTYVIPGLPIATTNITTTQRITSYAGFANAEYKITEKLSVLGGGRYTDTKTNFTSCLTGDPNSQETFYILGNLLSGVTTPQVSPTDCTNFAGTNDLAGGLAHFQIIRTPFSSDLEEHNTSFRAGLNFKPNRDTLIYGLVARGYKAGSFGDIQASVTDQLTAVKQEQLTDYEVGAKVTAFDRRVQLNAAAFYYDYKDKQVRAGFIDPIFGLLDKLYNIPKSRIEGAEADLTVRPMTGITLRGSISYVDSKVTEGFASPIVNNARISGSFQGSALPFSPKWNAVADARYDWSVGNNLGAFVGAHVLYNSSTNASLGQPAALAINAFAKLDLEAGIKSSDDRWALSVFGRNVTNTYHWNNAYEFEDVIVRLADMPVTYGVSLRFNLK